MENKKRVLLKNTAMLYILTLSTYALNFILVPYETRILGVDTFGLIGLASAIMVYFQLFIDFGFILSATEEVSKKREDVKTVSKIFSSVTILKLILTSLALLVLLILCSLIQRWKENMLLLILFAVASSINSLIPDYLYRGLEKMETITVRTVSIKVVFTALVFLFVKQPEDIILIPLFQVIGNAVALVIIYAHMHFKLGIGFVKCSFSDIISRMKASSIFFLSRIATTMYTAANTIILDFISAGTMTAFYTSADKIVSTAKSGLSPISDSLYPYMVRNKDFKLVKKLLLIFEPIIIAGCVVVFIFAKPLCILYFGADYAACAPVLQAMLPIIAVTLPTYIFGFPVLGAMGLNKHANYSVIVGSVFHLIALIVLYFSGNLNIISLAVTSGITESIILIYRIIVVLKNKNVFKGESDGGAGE